MHEINPAVTKAESNSVRFLVSINIEAAMVNIITEKKVIKPKPRPVRPNSSCSIGDSLFNIIKKL